MQFIKSVHVITVQGVKSYNIGDKIDGKSIHTIEKRALHFQGDPYDHYIGISEDGQLLFSVNCLIPCDVTYLTK